MGTIDKFNEVERRLEEIAKSLGYATSPSDTLDVYPRILIWVRRGRSSDVKVGGEVRQHSWIFEYVIQTMSADQRHAYEEAKRIHWEIYDRIMSDRTLGIKGFRVFASPAIEFERVTLQQDKDRAIQIWIQRVEVMVET